jgi:hypothetical protein
MNDDHSETDLRLLKLLHAARDDGDDTARAELNAWLRTSPPARARLARLLVDERALVNRLRDEQLLAFLAPEPLPFPDAQPAPPPATLLPRAKWAWSAAAVFALGLLTVLTLRFSPASAVAAPELMPVAVLQNQVEAVWRDVPLTAGAALTPGKFALESGLVAIEFNNGARVLIEGPAEFDLLSQDHVFFHSGRLGAEVPPPAIGFTISTPTMRVVDLGTRFGLSLSPEGTGVVRVEKGEIEVHKNSRQNNLREGDALAFDRNGEIDAALFPETLIPSESDLSERLAIAGSRRDQRWRRAFSHLAEDVASLLAFDFRPTRPTDRSVSNLARSAPRQSAASLVGAAWTEGRWPGKYAVEFRGPADRLRLQAPGTHRSLTLLCWLRVDSLPNEYNGLLIPHDYQSGSIQWMIRKDGQIRFSLHNGLASPGSDRGWDKHITAPALSPLDFGRWVFLATTYDSATGLVHHYRDGRSIGSGKLNRPLPAVLGSMGVGNWANSRVATSASEKSSSNYRNLVGCLDELTVLSRALSSYELAHYYESGRP